MLIGCVRQSLKRHVLSPNHAGRHRFYHARATAVFDAASQRRLADMMDVKKHLFEVDSADKSDIMDRTFYFSNVPVDLDDEDFEKAIAKGFTTIEMAKVFADRVVVHADEDVAQIAASHITKKEDLLRSSLGSMDLANVSLHPYETRMMLRTVSEVSKVRFQEWREKRMKRAINRVKHACLDARAQLEKDYQGDANEEASKMVQELHEMVYSGFDPLLESREKILRLMVNPPSAATTVNEMDIVHLMAYQINTQALVSLRERAWSKIEKFKRINEVLDTNGELVELGSLFAKVKPRHDFDHDDDDDKEDDDDDYLGSAVDPYESNLENLFSITQPTNKYAFVTFKDPSRAKSTGARVFGTYLYPFDESNPDQLRMDKGCKSDILPIESVTSLKIYDLGMHAGDSLQVLLSTLEEVLTANSRGRVYLDKNHDLSITMNDDGFVQETLEITFETFHETLFAYCQLRDANFRVGFQEAPDVYKDRMLFLLDLESRTGKTASHPLMKDLDEDLEDDDDLEEEDS